MRIPAWEGNWEKRIYDRLLQRDFSNLTAFADSRPTATLEQLAGELASGDDVAAGQLERLLRYEAHETGRVHRFARAALVREIYEFFPQGWMLGETIDFLRARVWSTWVVWLGEEHQPAAERVWDWLKRQAAVGWLPLGPDDPIIVQAFREGQFPEDADPDKKGEPRGLA